jgi:hypothetical protein
MISHGRLRQRRVLPTATAPWICDSRGFTELSQHGKWTIRARDYAASITRYQHHIGQLQWAAPQDWMCEPWILAKTGKTIGQHQQATVESVLLLRHLAPDVHIIPVLQGWQLADYLTCIDLYRTHGIDLRTEPVVGLGSICRRQSTPEIATIVRAIAATGIRLHGFGVKTAAMSMYGLLLASADSWAWSYAARRDIGACPHGTVKWEANCRHWALTWRCEVLRRIVPVQPALDLWSAA